jgi:hypothetical protein
MKKLDIQQSYIFLCFVIKTEFLLANGKFCETKANLLPKFSIFLNKAISTFIFL